jgi:hypothetical protein
VSGEEVVNAGARETEALARGPSDDPGGSVFTPFSYQLHQGFIRLMHAAEQDSELNGLK